MLIACNNRPSNPSNNFPFVNEQPTYEQKVRTVEEEEKANPLRFVSVDVKYNSNFWGDKVKLDGEITNTATVANFKDVIVKITFYTKTRTRIRSEKITIYEFVNAGRRITFFKKISAPSNYSTITAEIISATPY